MIARIKINAKYQRNSTRHVYEWVYYGWVYSDKYPKGRIVWWGDWRDTLTHCCDYLYHEHLMEQEAKKPRVPRQFDLYKAR